MLVVALISCAFGDPNVVKQFTFADFSNQSSLSVSGLPVQPANILRLTDARASQMGVAWFNQKVFLRGFRTQFTIQISNTTVDHANGMSFVMQAEGLTAEGVGGSGLGYGDVNSPGVEKGIIDSVCVEFDTHQDNDTSGINALGDPNANHISVHSRGLALANSADQQYALANGTTTAINPLWGVAQTVTIEFTPQYFAISVAPLTGAVLNMTSVQVGDWMTLDAYGAAYIGFTASTGSSSGETFDVLSWSYEFLGAPDASRFIVFGSGVTSAIAGELGIVFVQLVDQWSFNLTDAAGVSLTAALSAPPQVTNVTYIDDGVFEIAYNATLAGVTSITIDANGVPVRGSPVTPTITPNAVAPRTSLLTGAVTGVFVAGSALLIGVQTRDAFGNNCTGTSDTVTLELSTATANETIAGTSVGDGAYVISWTETRAAVWQVRVLVNGAATSAVPTTLTIEAGALDASQCHVTLNADAVAGVNATISIDLVDRWLNAVLASTVTAQTTFIAGNDTAENATLSCAAFSVAPTSSSVYQIAFTCLTADRYLLAIAAASTGMSLLPVSGSPFAVHVHSGTAMNASATTVASPFIDNGPQPASTSAVFILTTFDFNRNQREVPSPNFTVIMLDATANATLETVVAYDIAGAYIVTTSLIVARTFILAIMVDGVSVHDSPFTVSVAPDAAAAAATTIVDVSALNNSETDRQTTFVVQLCDKYGNRLTTTPTSLSTALSASLTPTMMSGSATAPPAVSVQSTGNGTYACAFTPTNSGVYTLSVALSSVPIGGSPFTMLVAWAGLSNEIIIIIAASVLLLFALAAVGVCIVRKLSRRAQYSEIRPAE